MAPRDGGDVALFFSLVRLSILLDADIQRFRPDAVYLLQLTTDGNNLLPSVIFRYAKAAPKTLDRTCFRGPRSRNWKWSSLIMLSSPRIPLFIRLNANCERKINLWRSNNPLLTQVKMVMRKASRRLSTRPSTVSDGFAFVMDLRKKVTKESSEYWYMWSMRHLVAESGHAASCLILFSCQSTPKL